MKLLFCHECLDIFNLTIGKVKACECGNIKGMYLNNSEAEFITQTPHYSLLGFSNSSLSHHLKEYEQRSASGQSFIQGVPFESFIIPEPCPTFEKVKEFSEVEETQGGNEAAQGSYRGRGEGF